MKTSGKYFKEIQTIHIALMIGILFFGAIACIMNYLAGKITDDKTLENILIPFVAFFVIAEVAGSQLFFKIKLKDCKKQVSLKDKLDGYRSALIVKFAMVEGAAFFAIIAFFLTGNLLFLGFIILLFFVFLFYKPTRLKLIEDLKLSLSEEEKILNPESLIE